MVERAFNYKYFSGAPLSVWDENTHGTIRWEIVKRDGTRTSYDNYLDANAAYDNYMDKCEKLDEIIDTEEN